MKPITPDEVLKGAGDYIPDFVYETINDLLKKNYRGKSDVVIEQNEIITAILSIGIPNLTRDKIFEENWLDIEQAYINAGWKVIYEKPGYNESFRAFFRFSK